MRRPSGEMEMRWTLFATGIVAMRLRFTRSSTLTLPALTLAVYPRWPSSERTSMWDCGSPVGISASSLRVEGSITPTAFRSEEHTSELQSHHDLVCRLLLEKKKKHTHATTAQ